MQGLECKEPRERSLSPKSMKKPGVDEKLISSNLRRGIESKEPIKYL